MLFWITTEAQISVGYRIIVGQVVQLRFPIHVSHNIIFFYYNFFGSYFAIVKPQFLTNCIDCLSDTGVLGVLPKRGVSTAILKKRIRNTLLNIIINKRASTFECLPACFSDLERSHYCVLLMDTDIFHSPGGCPEAVSRTHHRADYILVIIKWTALCCGLYYFLPLMSPDQFIRLCDTQRKYRSA